MLPTPSTSHINFDHIYPPSEDSFLLIDALALPSVVAYHHSRFSSNLHSAQPSISPPQSTTSSPSPIILEVGTGSGVVLAFATAHAQTLFGRSDVLALGVDVNHFACLGTRETIHGAIAEQHQARTSTATNDGLDHTATSGILLDVLQSNLTSSLRPKSIDILLFNPPYVPSETLPQAPGPSSLTDSTTLNAHETFTRDSALLALATDGGADGMEITDILLAQLSDVLSERGVAYVLLCAQNRPKEVMERLKKEGWEVEVVHTSGKQGGWEQLCIVRIARRME